jgi:hypothetical protein
MATSSRGSATTVYWPSGPRQLQPNNWSWENTVTGEHTIWILNKGVALFSTKLPTISVEWQIVN